MKGFGFFPRVPFAGTTKDGGGAVIVTNYRITQDSNRRITENGNPRIVEP